MSEEVKNKKKSDKEILAADNSELNNDELDRKLKLIDIESKLFQAELVRRQTDQMKMKDAEQKDKFWSRGRELANTKLAQARHQGICSHRKGGKGIDALQKGGTDASDYALIRHLLPWNEIYVRCQRCGKTWAPPKPENFNNLKTVEDKAAFDQARLDYKWASVDAPTNNSMSTGITFQHHSEDDDRTAKKFVQDSIRDVNLR